MVTLLPQDFWQNLYDRTDTVKLSWIAYSVNAAENVGGGTKLTANYNRPTSGEGQFEGKYRDSYALQDILSGNADLVPANYVPPNFIATGIWDRPDKFPTTGTVRSLTNLDTFDMDPVAGLLSIGLLSQDGSAAVYDLPNVPGNPGNTNAQTIGQLLQQVFNCTTAQINPSVTDSKFASWYPIEQGAMTDILRKIAGLGVYMNVKLLGTIATPVLIKTFSAPQRVRLLGMDKPIRSLVNPNYVASLQVNNYNSSRAQNVPYYRATTTYSVDSNTTTQVRVQMNGTPGQGCLTQPTTVPTIPVIPFNGPQSCYVVYDSNGYEASARWNARGGTITAAIGNSPNELLLTFIGPAEPVDQTQTYTISDGINHPALYVCATDGIVTNMRSVIVPTGAVVPTNTFRPADVPTVIDNDLITTNAVALDRAQVAIAGLFLPKLQIQQFTFQSAELFVNGYNDTTIPVDELIGSVFRYQASWWRITQLAYDSATDTYTGSAEQHTLCQHQVDDTGTLTIAQYNAQLQAMWGGGYPTLQQINMEPLLEAVDLA